MAKTVPNPLTAPSLSTFQSGEPVTVAQWQTLNKGLEQASQSPWWSKQSFADRFMEKRDEFYVGFTYQF